MVKGVLDTPVACSRTHLLGGEMMNRPASIDHGLLVALLATLGSGCSSPEGVRLETIHLSLSQALGDLPGLEVRNALC
jgi:hypothetical protein